MANESNVQSGALKTLQPHQQRVVDEKTELDTKRTKLLAFLTSTVFQSLDIAERERLTRQSDIMLDYSEVLGQRIAAF